LRQSFFLPGVLSTFTQALNARAILLKGKSKGNRRVDKYTELKQAETLLVAWIVRPMIAEGKLVPVDVPVRYFFTWVRKNKRTDPDNISHAQKYLLDGFRMAGLIPNDTWKFVSKLNHAFASKAEIEATLEVGVEEGVFVHMEWD
jgi:hypothetical protein